jgi:hypothetical protein
VIRRDVDLNAPNNHPFESLTGLHQQLIKEVIRRV